MNRKTDIRTLPAVEIRVETGPVQFGDDWPGLFVRGDNAFHLAMVLEQFLVEMPSFNSNTKLLMKVQLGMLLDALKSCNLNHERTQTDER